MSDNKADPRVYTQVKEPNMLKTNKTPPDLRHGWFLFVFKILGSFTWV